MRRLRWIILFVVIAGGVVAFLGWPRGVRAIIHNSGATAMRDVRVNVTGRSYWVGDLGPGESRAIRVKPIGESHIVLSYADGSGVARRLTVDCYFESGYSGSIAVDVADGVVANVDDRIRLAMW
jgi:hypothetical protein